MRFKVIFFLLFLMPFSCFASISEGHVRSDVQGSRTRPPSEKDDDEKSTFGSLENEMRVRNAIKYAEKIQQENVARAREAMELSFKLRSAYNDNKAFNSTDRKAIEHLDKIVRRIRSAVGGSAGDEDEMEIPQDTATALSRLTEAAEALRTGVEKTSRLVVSAAVIERANELLQLTQYLRRGAAH